MKSILNNGFFVVIWVSLWLMMILSCLLLIWVCSLVDIYILGDIKFVVKVIGILIGINKYWLLLVVLVFCVLVKFSKFDNVMDCLVLIKVVLVMC